MQIHLLLAGILAILVGLIHSIFGEVLIFSRMRNHQLVPTAGQPVLRERHVRILWASWHGATIFGWAMGAVLLMYALPHTEIDSKAFVLRAIAVAMAGFSALVLFATKGQHPGWLGLLAVAALIWFA
jgi:hypothetical protein